MGACTSGISVMQTVFFGDSHAHALIRALAKLGGQGDMTAVDIRRIGDGKTNDKTIPPNLAQVFPADRLFCCLGGTEYNLLGLIESDKPFDFLTKSDDSILPGRHPVPLGLVRASLAARLRSALGRMSEVRAQYDCPFTCVAPPPPFAHIDDAASLPRAFLPHLDRGIAPASVRQKLYTIQVELVKSHCKELGIGFLPAPISTQDSDGFLVRSFWRNDPTHGNAQYGAAVIEQMRDLQLA